MKFRFQPGDRLSMSGSDSWEVLDLDPSKDKYHMKNLVTNAVHMYARDLVDQYCSIIPSDGCIHEFRMYYGLRESYEFCTKCDKKRHET